MIFELIIQNHDLLLNNVISMYLISTLNVHIYYLGNENLINQ